MKSLISYNTSMKMLSISCVAKVNTYQSNNVAEIGKRITIGNVEYPVYRTKKSKEFGVYAAYINARGVLFDCGNVLNCH